MDRKSISTLIKDFDKKFLEAFSKQPNFEIKYKPLNKKFYFSLFQNKRSEVFRGNYGKIKKVGWRISKDI